MRIGKTMKNLVFLTSVLLSLALYTNLSIDIEATSQPVIKNIDHTPEKPPIGGSVTFYATVYGESISSVKVWILECHQNEQGEIDFCSQNRTINMDNIGGNEYRGITTLQPEINHVSYKIIVTYNSDEYYETQEYEFIAGEIENSRPYCRILNPRDNSVLSNTVTVNGVAGDPDGNNTLEKVEIKIDNGQWIKVNRTTSWSYQLDTTQFSNGQHTLYTRAYDGEKYSGVEDDIYNRITFTVENEEQPSENQAPTVSITYPRDGTTVSGIVNITGTASDPNGDNTIDRVEIKLGNGNWQLATGTVNWYYIWDTSSIDYEEDFSISARVYDVNGSSSLKVISVTINNQGGNSRPTVTITSPEDGTIVTEKTIKIEGTASDPDGSISIVKIRIGGGEWKTASGTTSWSYNLDVSNLIKGPITIKVVAYDDKNLASQEATITLNIQYQPGKGNGTPGFEIIFMITAILIILFLRGKKNEH